MIVMNRNAKENLEIPLASTFQMQVREPYLIFRLENRLDSTTQQKIRGIWFHDGKERQDIVEVLNRVIKSLSVATELEPFPPEAQSRRPSMSMVSRENAAASLMATLKIGEGSGLDPPSTAQEQPQQQPQQQQQKQQSEKNPEADIHNMILDKKSLQLSLMSLLQDDRFLDLIHAQYLKVAKARSSGNATKKL